MFALMKKTSLSLAALSLLAVVPAHAQSSVDGEVVNPDGYCYVKKSDRAVEDALVGAAAGAVAGTVIAKKGDKKKGAVIGAAAGAGIGALVGSEAAKKVKCYGGQYFVFTKGYYEPIQKRKFKIVFFETRPEGVNLYVITKSGKEVPYKAY